MDVRFVMIRVSPKGISMICSVLFPVVLLAEPLNFSIAAAVIIALRPALGLQPTIPRSGNAAARAPRESPSRTESWAMKK